MIELQAVGKSYQDKVVLKDINLKIQTGEFICLVGPSGSGKTTLLKMLNRLVEPSRGKILLDNRPLEDQSVQQLRLNTGYVLQEVALFPHMTVFENIALMLELKKIPRGQWRALVKDWLLKVDLNPELLERYPSELSGGQQQRVGIVRALITKPKVILMDEPFSALDPLNRRQLQALIKRLQVKYQLTIVFVTHDMAEAKLLADRLALIYEGTLLQFGPVAELLGQPKNSLVTQFLQGGKAID